MPADSSSPEATTELPHQPQGPAASPSGALNPMPSMAQSGGLCAEQQSPHLVVFSGGTAFNGIAGHMRKEFPRGAHSSRSPLPRCMPFHAV